MTSLRSDERGIIASYLVKVVLVMALIGGTLIEGVTILFTRLQVQDAAESAATSGAARLGDTGDCAGAGEAATTTAHDKVPEARVTSYECNPEDMSFTVVLRKRASTLVVHRIGFMEGLAVAESKVTARPPEASG